MRERTHECKFCEKKFGSEQTLSVHMCVKKRRWVDRNSVGARIGFRVFQIFFELTTNAKKPKTQEEFINSKYYTSFVKFGRYLVELDPIDTEQFVDFVIKNGVKLKDWCKPYVYETYLEEKVSKEPVERALERTIITMQEWAERNNTNFNDFFKEVSTNEATFLIRSGKISPWVLHLSNTGGELIDRMNLEQGKIIQEIINPNKWHAKFIAKIDDCEYVKQILDEANI